MFKLKIFILLSVFVSSVISTHIEAGNFFLERVFDYDLYENVLDPELCQEQLSNSNAFEFYDASFRVPQGILKGNSMSIGNFHQCIGIKQYTNGEAIEGKYCMIRTTIHDIMKLPRLSGTSWTDDVDWINLNINTTVKTMENYRKTVKFGRDLGDQMKRIEGIGISNAISFSLALCIPKTCSVDDVLIPLLNNSVVDFEYEEEFCRLPGDKPLVAADYTAIVIFSIIGILTLLSTAYDVRHRFLLKKDPAESDELLRSFSLYTNSKTLLTFNDGPSGAIDCIDGIRSISIMWIIIGHTFLAFISRYTANLFDFFEWFGQQRNIWLRSATISVDTFFILSGLLLVYTSVKKMRRKQLLKNLHVFYLNRLLRMFPLLALTVLLQASVFNHVSDGANWHFMAEQVEPCRKYWWSALLHIQNIVNTDEYCIPQSWYLSVDMQLHILSPLLLFWVLGSRRSGWTGLIIGFVATLTASTVYCFLKDFSYQSNHLKYFYKNTLTRSPPFLVGMVFGYILHVFRGKKPKLSFPWVFFGYSSAWVVSSYCLYYTYTEWDSEFLDSLHRSFRNAAWGTTVCWIIFACVHGYGGPVNWFLSLTIWKFVARISYAMYLLHYSVLFAVVGSTVTSFHFSLESIFLMCCSVMVYTMIASVAACILIDAPFSILQRRFLKVITISTTPTRKQEISSPKHDTAPRITSKL